MYAGTRTLTHAVKVDREHLADINVMQNDLIYEMEIDERF